MRMTDLWVIAPWTVLNGSMTNDPAEDLAVLRIREKDGSWEPEELALLDFRNWSASISFQGVQGPIMSNGEIWFESQGRDTPGVWYAVQKGADDGPIRRITVPESFQPRDVTATHVWGIRRDELDVGYVTGLRLVPGSGTGSQ